MTFVLGVGACTTSTSPRVGSPSTSSISSTSSSGSGAACQTTSTSTTTTQAAGPGGPAASSGSQYTPTGAYTLSSGTATKTNATFAATSTDESGVLVSGGSLTLGNPTINTSGNSSSSDASSFYGLNAGVLVQSPGTATITGGSVATTGAGANGIFSYGSAASVTASKTKVTAAGQYSHGVMASGGGTLKATNVNAATAGASSAAVATDRGGGSIVVRGGSFKTTGGRSPAIYSTGAISVTNASMSATGAEAAVIEGGNSIAACDSVLKGAVDRGVMIYNSTSGDAAAGTGSYTMSGGSLSAAAGPAFYVTNAKGVITVDAGAKVSADSGVLLRADSTGTGSGNAGAATVTFTATGVALKGAVSVDDASSAAVTLGTRASLSGSVAGASMALVSSSKWIVQGDSSITTLTDASGTSNIIGNGHTVTYAANEAANSWLGGKTYSLSGGGTLRPS